LSTWRGGDSTIASPSSETIGRAEVGKVFKGKLTQNKIVFRDSRSMLPEDLNTGLGTNANSITFTLDLRYGTRYMLFLSSDSASERNQRVSMYKLDFAIPLAPSGDTRLRLDASSIRSGDRKRELVDEFVNAANFVLDSGGNPSDAYDYFSYVYEVLGTDRMPFVQKLLDSPEPRLRYFAAL
jgi:hypothetical protein